MRVAAKTAKKITATITTRETQVIALQRVFLCQGVGYKANSKCGIFAAVSTQFQSLASDYMARAASVWAFPPTATAVSDVLSQFLRWLSRVPGKRRTPYGAMFPRWEINLGRLVLG
jgi:hypothetical protein